MNTIFRWQVMLGWFSIFMDDGVIHTKQRSDETKEQHIARHQRYVHEIFDILAENDLYVKPEKCTFEQEEIEYLGVIVGKGQLRMDPKKLHAVLNYPTPRNTMDIRAFLGFTGYVTAYFNLSSYLYLSRLIHDASLIIYELSVPLARLQHVSICTRARVNAYRTYLLSRYLAVNYLTSQRVFSHSTYLFRTHIPTLT